MDDPKVYARRSWRKKRFQRLLEMTQKIYSYKGQVSLLQPVDDRN